MQQQQIKYIFIKIEAKWNLLFMIEFKLWKFYFKKLDTQQIKNKIKKNF